MVIVAAVLQFLLGTGGFYGAYMLLRDTSGAYLGVPPDLLDRLPVDNFLVPGIFLLVFLGVLPFVNTIGLLRPATFSSLNRMNVLNAYLWPFSWSIFTASYLIVWTIGELALWGVNFLSVFYLIWGIVSLLLMLLPAIRSFYRKTDQPQ